MLKILFVCTGNICRSPTAHGVLLHKVKQLGLEKNFLIESRGLFDYHVGEKPDRRTMEHAKKRGYDFSSQRACHFSKKDFIEFDLIFAMDVGHLEKLHALCNPEHQSKIHLWLSHSAKWRDQSVPDPYYGNAAGFELVLDMIEESCDRFLSATISPDKKV